MKGEKEGRNISSGLLYLLIVTGKDINTFSPVYTDVFYNKKVYLPICDLCLHLF